jgi:hypothetical protein
MAISIRLNKSFPYRGVPEIYSNTYHFTGTAPTSDANWDALIDALVVAEKATHSSETTIVYASCYTADHTPAAHTRDFNNSPDTPVAGTFVFSPSAGNVMSAGDAAVWVRWKTDHRDSRGHQVYVRNYFHHVAVAPPDTVAAAQKTAFQTFGAAMVTGFISGAYKLSDLQGHAVSTPTVPSFITTRTLKRRGKSPL